MEPEQREWLAQIVDKVMREGKAPLGICRYVTASSLLTVGDKTLTVEDWHHYLKANSVLHPRNDLDMTQEDMAPEERCTFRLRASTSSALNALSEYRDFDRDDPNLTKTPERVAKALLEITDGYDVDVKALLSTSFPSDEYDQMIVVKDIDYYSTCAHHMFPFHGKVAIGYLPNAETKQVVGLSKLPRLVRAFSRRLQNQERMTMQIAKAIEEHLEPRGVGVLVYDSIHLCSHMRGVEESHSTMETSALLGEFRDDATVRQEFMSMVYGGRR